MPRGLHVGIVAPFASSGEMGQGGMTVLAEAIAKNLENDGAVVSRINTCKLWSNCSTRSFLLIFRQHLSFYRSLMRALNHDVYFLISSSGLSFYTKIVPALYVLKIKRLPVILDFVGGGILGKFNRCNLFFLRKFQTILVPTQTFQRSFLAKGVPTTVFPHIVEIEKFYGDSGSRAGPTFVCAKSLESYSGINFVIQAFSLIQKRIPAATLVIIGTGPEKRNLELLVKSLDADNVQFAGSVTHGGVADIFSSASIFLHGTQVESFGLVLVEAMAAGLPIISTNVGGIPDIITSGHNGILVECGDYKEMARQALVLLRDRKLYEDIQTNGFIQSKKYSGKLLISRLKKIFGEVVKNK